MRQSRGAILLSGGLVAGALLGGWAVNLGVAAQDRFIGAVATAAQECHNCMRELPVSPSREWCEQTGSSVNASGQKVGAMGSTMNSALFFDAVQHIARRAWAEKSVWERLRSSVFESSSSDVKAVSLLVRDQMFEIRNAELLSDTLAMCNFMSVPMPSPKKG